MGGKPLGYFKDFKSKGKADVVSLKQLHHCVYEYGERFLCYTYTEGGTVTENDTLIAPYHLCVWKDEA